MFTTKELHILDAPTADNEVVLASLGGKPSMPDDIFDENADTEIPETNHNSNDTITREDEDKWSVAERGGPRQGLRERGGAWREA